jgi:hypothetical protein
MSTRILESTFLFPPVQLYSPRVRTVTNRNNLTPKKLCKEWRREGRMEGGTTLILSIIAFILNPLLFIVAINDSIKIISITKLNNIISQ